MRPRIARATSPKAKPPRRNPDYAVALCDCEYAPVLHVHGYHEGLYSNEDWTEGGLPNEAALIISIGEWRQNWRAATIAERAQWACHRLWEESRANTHSQATA